MTDQAEALRRLVLETTAAADAEQCGGGALLLVHGTDRAAAARQLGLHLALTMRRRHRSAALVDISPEPSAWYLASAAPRAKLCDVIERRRTLREAWQIGPCGLPVVSGALNDWSSCSTRVLTDQLQIAARRQRVIVTTEDLAELRAFLPAANHCLFVTPADADRLTSTYQTIKSVATELGAARGWLVLTQASDQVTARDLQQRIVTACDRCLNFALSPLGALPPDPALTPVPSQDSSLATAAVSDLLRRELEQMLERLDTDHRSPPRQRFPRRAERAGEG
jgi:hypothetical protein